MSMSSHIEIIHAHKSLYKIHQSQPNSEQIPRWLLEFSQKFITTNQSQPNISNLRPSSESFIHRPKWFEELSQKRRMSDIGNMNLDESRALYNNSSNSNVMANNKINYDLDPIKDFNNRTSLFSGKSNDIKTIDNIDDDDDTFLPSSLINHRQETKSLKKTPINRSSSNVDNGAPGYDDHLFSFSSNTFKSIENLRLDEMSKSIEEDCIIPEMPTGNELVLILLENWGDQHFIGLNGIEILDQCGNRPRIKNVFLENDSKKRLEMNDLSKLIDNVYRTHDDAHIWQYRFTDKPLPVSIIFEFEKTTTIALIRIWNHNKSRIHSYRGVRYAKCKLDEQTIFCGEIAKASGDLTGSLENFGDTILFTTNDEILEQISHFDVSFQELLMEQMK